MPSSVLAFESGFPLFKICHFNLLLPNVGGIITLPLFLLQTSVPTTAATTTCRLCWHTKAAPAHQVTMWDGSRGKKVTTVVSHSTVFSMCVVISMLYIHMHTGTWVYTDVQEHFLFFFFFLWSLSDEWVKFDDDKVSVVSPEDILRLSGGGDWHIAYVLLYGPRRLEILEEEQ